jgi:4'-phosphopantetheinyl transferase EntD
MCYIETLHIQRKTGSFKACLATSQETLSTLQTLKDNFLHPDERSYFNTLTVSKRQHSYLNGRYTAKQAVAAYTDIMPASVKISAGVFQQPVLPITNVQLSLSHTDRWCIALVFPEAHPMGVDVEFISAEIYETTDQIITAHERTLFTVLDAGYLSLLWTMKEALSKTLRTGLMTPLQIYEVSEIVYKNGLFEAYFTNFAQYKSLSWIAGDHAWSIVLPKNSMVDTATFIHPSLR